MKLSFRDIEPFVKSPNKAARLIVVYGPDTGLVRERAMTMSKHYVADLNDPFNVARLTGDVLDSDPSRLLDEAQARSMMGGMRLIHITDPSDKIEPALKTYLKDNPNPDAIIIIEAGELKPASKLRKLAETAPNAAAVPCYVEEAKDLIPLLRDMLKTAGLQADQDALVWFANNVKGDRQRVRMEAEKLIIYMGDETRVTLRHMQDCCGEAGAQSFDELVYGVLGQNKTAGLAALRKLMEEGTDTTMVFRIVQNHLFRLHMVKTMMDQHQAPLDEAMGALQPPVFFKQADAFKAHIRQWSVTELHGMMQRLSQAEMKTRQTGMPQHQILAHTLMTL